jgi:hypothetical protein
MFLIFELAFDIAFVIEVPFLQVKMKDSVPPLPKKASKDFPD